MTTKQALDKIEELKKFIEKSKEITWTKIGDFEISENLGKMNWNDAMAEAKEMGGRLPERWEWIKMVDENYDELQKLIKDDDSNSFWSATENSATLAWNVTLYFGTTNATNKTTLSYQVRAVRAK
jgi:hypothetical protein